MAAAIVTTLRLPAHADTVLVSFLDYHLAIGFQHVFIFFDSEVDPSLGAHRVRLHCRATHALPAEIARAYDPSRVTVIVRTAESEASARRGVDRHEFTRSASRSTKPPSCACGPRLASSTRQRCKPGSRSTRSKR